MTDVALSEEIDHAGPCGCARDWYVIGCICPSCVIGEAIRLGYVEKPRQNLGRNQYYRIFSGSITTIDPKIDFYVTL